MAVSDDAAWQRVDGRVVMLQLDSEHYYRLDTVGSRMWELLDELGEIGRVHARLLDEFDVDPAVLSRDLEVFVAELAAAGLVTVEPASA